jgi:YHS domain-containing protein
MAKDPVCGMQVDENKAQVLNHEGHLYYFCRQDCKKAFQENPKKYIQKDPAVKK